MSLANNAIANRDQRIADLAHQFWEQEGRPEGRAEHHWLRAAAQIDHVSKTAPKRKPATKKASPAK
jgi:hypothetical protein